MGVNNYQAESHIPLEAINNEFQRLGASAPPLHQSNKPDSYLSRILETSAALRRRKAQTIHFSDALICIHEQGVVFPRTINVIQGQSGVHKSRFAGLLASLLLSTQDGSTTATLGFSKLSGSAPVVCYTDTERNLSDQLPFALQQIQLGAGFSKTDEPENYVYASLLEFRREERFEALESYLNHLRETFSKNIVIILDVVSDCVSDFNRTDDSMRLIDMMNLMINRYDLTFLCVIHENPNQQKARGHLGTELFNKATTVIQISMEQDGAGNPTDVVRVRFLKCRNSKCPAPIYAQIDPETNTLVEVGMERVEGLRDGRRRKATETDILEYLERLNIKQMYPKSDLIERLQSHFSASDKIVAQRLEEIIELGRTFHVQEQICVLEKRRTKQVFYIIQPFISKDATLPLPAG